jgi:hypothetical protein
MPQLSKREIKELILLAAQRVNKDEDLLRDDQALQQAIDYFEKNAATQPSPQELANTALIGVVSSYVSGSVPAVVRFNWGNLTAVPDLNPFGGGGAGGATIDQANRVDYKYGDSLGTEGRAIANFIAAGEFDEDFLEFLKQNGFNVGYQSPSPFKTTPEP